MPCRVSLSLVTDLSTLLVNCRENIPYFALPKAVGSGWLKSLLSGMVIIVSLGCTNAFGAHITLVTEFSVSVKQQGLVLVVMTENRGDVPAHDVQFEVIVEDKLLVGLVVKKLQVDEKASVNFSLADAFGIPGRYPVVIRTNYKDANGYRFTALTVGFYDYQSTVMPVASISGDMISIPVDGKGRMSFVLRNDGRKVLKIDLVLFVPNELSVSHEQSVIEIGPQQEQALEYEVENYSALANSRYQVSLVGRYEENEKRFGIAGSAVVQVTGDVKTAVKPVWIWVLLGGLMPSVIVFMRLKKQWA